MIPYWLLILGVAFLIPGTLLSYLLFRMYKDKDDPLIMLLLVFGFGGPSLVGIVLGISIIVKFLTG